MADLFLHFAPHTSLGGDEVNYVLGRAAASVATSNNVQLLWLQCMVTSYK